MLSRLKYRRLISIIRQQWRFHGGNGAEKQLLVFDLDGTLIESSGDVTHALNTYLSEKKDKNVELRKSEVVPMIGDGMAALLKRACFAANVELRDENIKAEVLRFGQIYDAQDFRNTTVLPGVVETLEELRSEGHSFALCTNKDQAPTVQILLYFGLKDYFSSIVGGNVLPVQKPNAGHLISAIETAGGDINNALMIGDGHNDVLVARNAGVPCIALRCGYSKIALEELRPAIIVDNIMEVPAAIERLVDSSTY